MEESTEKSEYEKAKALLTGYLNERMRVTISDGRVIDGRLICTDRDCNLVLSNCEEFLSTEEMSKEIIWILSSVHFELKWHIELSSVRFVLNMAVFVHGTLERMF